MEAPLAIPLVAEALLVERSSSTDGTDECLLRAFADLAFPSSPDDTQVTVTLSFNAAMR